ncbi:hypothetical protein FQV26_05810 [Planococcus sp. CPCC 101016]|uniref:hypothetical protein n=1 Tax=Planococcus sp. CPCC 101016 TaxID=2599617 RepID=UPI0011B3884E|nr:hypothetical protein [Planococcus sp. CPCC 101016]TWT07326.1 hypothetical protein FQV26_05810 [Planococcus sp. CPCC 101016]
MQTFNYTKEDVLSSFRTKVSKIYDEVKHKKDPTKHLNNGIKKVALELIDPLIENLELTNNQKLDKILLVHYCMYIVMIEFRNRISPYEYMAFTRRIGELWEPFCKLCWTFTSEEGIAVTIPPTFDEAKIHLSRNLNNFIGTLNLSTEQKTELDTYLELIWELVSSGGIKLKSDLHFEKNGVKYNVDFKSGFNSNEKGNTNRLLMVGSIFKKLDPAYENIILVRAEEKDNNHYLQTLKNSDQWNVFCGQETYDKIEELTGFPLKVWIRTNIDWKNDLDKDTIDYLTNAKLDQYLSW